jgi:nicotinate-nucleotide--dimethylbenzimidazole phosphoribosyltransferase
MLGGAASRRPVILDGLVSGAAALIACGLGQGARGYLIAGHRSTEPGHQAALEHLGLEPLIDLGMRLGEGTGAALALPIVESAAAVVREMWTFGEAGVSDRQE